MGNYTSWLEDNMYSVLDSDDLKEDLVKVAASFRSFGVALDEFIANHGYAGDMSDSDAMLTFIASQMKAHDIPVPRKIKNWYNDRVSINKDTAIQMCFAFDLSVEDSEAFLRKVCLMRGFDCHKIDELIYYYALNKGIAYIEARKIIDTCVKEKPTPINFESIVYTDEVLDYVKTITSLDMLNNFIDSNRELFRYNNATASSQIKRMWKDITKAGGIADRERAILYANFDDESIRDRSRQRAGDSDYGVLLQILGLAGDNYASRDSNRSLKPILKNNLLLHYLAEDSFPDRDGIGKIINGVHVSEERIRKTIILLAFYRFWASKALDKKKYKADYNGGVRFITEVDSILNDARYPQMYLGNPYDYLFICCSEDDTPLQTFRSFMREIYYAHYEDDDTNKSSM